MKDKAKEEALSTWRRDHWKAILDDNLRVLTGIRDDPGAKDKDKIEAAKVAARMADCLSPEKVSATRPADGQTCGGAVSLTEAEEKKLEAILHGINPAFKTDN